MAKRKRSPSLKSAKPRRKGEASEPDPEWDILQERFDSMNADFKKLAELIGGDREQ